MTLQASGAISLNQVNVELGLSGTAKISLNDDAVRKLLGKASGAISMQNAYGKKNEFQFVNTVARTNVNIFTLMGSPTKVDNYVFINNAEIGGSSSSVALRTGVFPAGSTLTIINNSYIRGVGGAGSSDTSFSGLSGGTAIMLDMACSMDNANGYIFAGGGGGGSTRRATTSAAAYYISAGGGGGAGSPLGAAGANNYKLESGAIGTNTAPKAGTATAGGAAGVIAASSEFAYGGVGGANGAAGDVGSVSAGGTIYRYPKIGVAGAAGRAILTNGRSLTQVAGFDSTRVKGEIV